jgi:hypothetical protein
MAWLPQPDWESSPEYRWVPSRVDEPESCETSLIKQAGLPDYLTAILLKPRLHFLQNFVRKLAKNRYRSSAYVVSHNAEYGAHWVQVWVQTRNRFC